MQISNWEKITKTKNFPPLNFISIEESQDRRDNLYKIFDEYGIKNVRPHIFKKYDDSEHIIVSDIPFVGGGRGPTTSHLKAIKEWYYTTDEPYAFFCEDDLSLETVQYWNFTWDEFLLSLPLNWECVQLSLVREQMFTFYQQGVILRPRCWCDWSACAYLIKRSHAKKLIGSYYRNGEFTLNYKGSDYEIRLSDNNHENFLRPIIETIVFTQFTNEESIFTFPLFVEDSMNFSTTWCDNENSVNTKSYLEIIDWWKSIGSKLTLDQINPYKLENKDI
jgi:GR25 family glycosyltransferase involved in LPS biosynthesis